MDQKTIKAKSYTLRTPEGHWLGQVVLTSDGMFSAVTDYGNFGFAWRSTSDEDFRNFMATINVEYFATKMYSGISYLVYSKQVEKKCQTFANKILPPLQEVLKKDLSENKEW